MQLSNSNLIPPLPGRVALPVHVPPDDAHRRGRPGCPHARAKDILRAGYRNRRRRPAFPTHAPPRAAGRG